MPSLKRFRAMPNDAPYLGQRCVTRYLRREVLLRWPWETVQDPRPDGFASGNRAGRSRTE